MKRVFEILVFSIFFITFSKCQVTESDSDRYIKKFEKNKFEFEKLVEKICLNKTLIAKIGHSINEDDINAEIKKKLDKLEIGNINILNSNCDGVVIVEFVANWTNKATVYLDKDECNKTNTKIGYHSKVGNIEVWGLGNGWAMWIDYDYI